jgi:AraC-like DNA-binding protein
VGLPRIRFYRPVEKLRGYISSYYFTDIDAGPEIHDLLHPEWANIRFVLTGFWTARMGDVEVSSADKPVTIYGPTSRACRIAGLPPTRTVGIGLLPLGWAQLISQPAHRFSDRIRALEEVFPQDAPRLRQGLHEAPDDAASCAILDGFFLSLAAMRPEPAAVLLRAHAALLDPTVATAQEFAARLDLSARHVARLSLDMFGFPPKLLLRRQRFLRTLDTMRARLDEPWATLLDQTYYDQSHFVRDFHRFMNMSPSEYFALPRVLLDPAARLRQQTIGQTLQGLHPTMSDLSKRS